MQLIGSKIFRRVQHIFLENPHRISSGRAASHGKDLCRTGTESGHKVVVKHYGLTTASIPLCHSGKDVEEGGVGGGEGKVF